MRDDLFRAMGLQTQTTALAGDGGVDVIAIDPDPIRGGRMVIQISGPRLVRHRSDPPNVKTLKQRSADRIAVWERVHSSG